MNEIEIRMANMGDFPLLSVIDLSFDTEYVWKSQIIEDLDTVSISFQNIKLPKTVHVPFQACSEKALELMVKRQEVVAIRCDNRAIGFIHLERGDTDDRLILKTGGIKPEYRHKGVGTMILESIQDMAIKNNIATLVAIVQAKNDPAIRFLSKKGFHFCGYQEFYFPNMEIALFFSKNVR